MFDKLELDPRFAAALRAAGETAADQVAMAHEIVFRNSDKLGGPPQPEIVVAVAAVIATNFAAFNRQQL